MQRDAPTKETLDLKLPTSPHHLNHKALLWKACKVLLLDLAKPNLNLEYLLGQHMTLTELQIVHATLVYLVEKEAFESNLKQKLDTLTKQFAHHVRTNHK
jgi:hypothetical protein